MVNSRIKGSLSNKSLLIALLIIIALIVWGNFIYQIKNDNPLTEDIEKELDEKKPNKSKNFPSNDISLITKNPFRAKFTSSNQEKIPKDIDKQKSPAKVVKTPQNLERIRYIGMIDSTALVDVNNETMHLKEGDSCLEFKIISVTKDSLILFYKKDYVIKNDSVIDLK